MTSLLDRIQQITEGLGDDKHSFFQLKYFVIGKEPTTQGKIRACMKELADRRAALLALEAEIAETSLALREIETAVPQEGNQAISRTHRINVYNHRLANLRSMLRGKEQESLFLIEMYEHLITIEQPKDWDDFEVQKEYWSGKLNMELSARLMMGLPVDIETVKTISAMPDDTLVKKNLLGLLNKQHLPDNSKEDK